MNTEVIKNFRLEIKKYSPKEIDEFKSEEYIFSCRNCQEKFRMQIEKEHMKYYDIEFNLSLHLMMCQRYSDKLDDI
jgi:hypothetical protein